MPCVCAYLRLDIDDTIEAITIERRWELCLLFSIYSFIIYLSSAIQAVRMKTKKK